MIRAGIGVVIEAQSDMALVAEVGDGLEAVAQFDKHRPDVTVIDLQMPRMSGLAAICAIRRRAPSTRIIVLTTYRGDVQTLRALKAGASGYLLKNMIRKDFLDAVCDVYAGKRYVAPEMAHELSARVSDGCPTVADRGRGHQRGRSKGTNWEVADRLGVSEEAIKTHPTSIFVKLGASDRLQAVAIAIRRGIVT